MSFLSAWLKLSGSGSADELDTDFTGLRALQKRDLYSKTIQSVGGTRSVVDIFVLLYVCLVWFLGGIVNGVTSFGGNLFAVPLMTLALDAKEAIIFGCLAGTSVTVSLAFFYHRTLPKREFLLAFISSGVGIPIGMAVLNVAPVSGILIGSGLFCFFFLSGRGCPEDCTDPSVSLYGASFLQAWCPASFSAPPAWADPFLPCMRFSEDGARM